MPRALTWSMSRAKTLEDCERRYFFEYVAGARRNSGDSRLRMIATLKRLKTFAMWQGEVFHTVAADFVRGLRVGRHLTSAQLAAQAAQILAGGWRASSIGALDGIALFEHAYAIPFQADVLSLAVERVGTWLARLAAWAMDVELATMVRGARRLWIEPNTFGPSAPGFRLDGVQVLAKVDLALHRPDGTFEIYDWKTTAQPPAASAEFSDSAEVQVTAYQLWPHWAFGVPLEAITAHVIYMGVSPVLVRTYAIDEDVREHAIRRVAAGIRRAKALHGLGDHAPLAEADFDLAVVPGMCRWCAFKRVCQEEPHDRVSSHAALSVAVGGQEELGI